MGTAQVSTLAEGQTTAAALERAVGDVDQELAELRDQEAAAAAEERRQALLQAAREAATDATAALEDSEDIRAKLDAYLRQRGGQLLQARRDHADARGRFVAAFRQLTGAPLQLESSWVSTDPEARQAVDELVAELEEAGVDLEAVRMALTGRGAGYLDRRPQLAELPMGDIIRDIVQAVANHERQGES